MAAYPQKTPEFQAFSDELVRTGQELNGSNAKVSRSIYHFAIFNASELRSKKHGVFQYAPPDQQTMVGQDDGAESTL
jgi:hypothetical protein